MNQEHRSEPSEPTGASTTGPIRSSLQALALLVVGILIGIGGFRFWTAHQDDQRLKLARQQAEVNFQSVVPEAGVRVDLLAKQLEDLDGELTEASVAMTSAAVDLSRYRSQQKRLQTQVAQVEQKLRRLPALAGSPDEPFRASAQRELLTAEQQAQLDELLSQWDRVRQGLGAIASQIDLARERRLQLAALEAEVRRRSQTENDLAAQRPQAEGFDRWESASVPRPQPETIQIALQTAPPSVSAAPPLPTAIYAQPAVVRPSAPLVIGSSYPDRFIGYRDWVRYQHYSPWYYSPYPLSYPLRPPYHRW